MKKFTAAMLTMALAGTMLTGCGSTAYDSASRTAKLPMSTALAVRPFGCSAQASTAVNRSRMALSASARNRAVDGCGTGCCVQPCFIAERMARR